MELFYPCGPVQDLTVILQEQLALNLNYQGKEVGYFHSSYCTVIRIFHSVSSCCPITSTSLSSGPPRRITWTCLVVNTSGLSPVGTRATGGNRPTPPTAPPRSCSLLWRDTSVWTLSRSVLGRSRASLVGWVAMLYSSVLMWHGTWRQHVTHLNILLLLVSFFRQSFVIAESCCAIYFILFIFLFVFLWLCSSSGCNLRCSCDYVLEFLFESGPAIVFGKISGERGELTPWTDTTDACF